MSMFYQVKDANKRDKCCERYGEDVRSMYGFFFIVKDRRVINGFEKSNVLVETTGGVT